MPPDTSTPPRGRSEQEAEVRPPRAVPRQRAVRERGWRRAVAVGLAFSVLAHLLLLLLSGTLPVLRPTPLDPTPARPSPEGLVLIELGEPEAPPPEAEEVQPELPEQPEATEPPAPREPPEPREPPAELLPEAEAVPAVPAPETPVPEVEPEDPLTNAERLHPRMGDERLWVEFDRPVVTERLERYARADSALRAILRDWLDSLRLTEEQRRRATDWTFGEGDHRWGISEEGLHLGDVTIPIPFGQLFQETGDRGREARQALRELQEIRAQEARREAEEAWDERREEMRQRSRDEAERRRSDTSSRGG